ncbi:metal-dependent phosphohydrolase [Rhizobium calliandrae]|uniref:Metal-dependent phosphohydrolase n=1 Tax=Rhizobium calliandrae TaxID=1312182 RepID=A0ABT7KHP7_9HYPH|nr:metal-dependent phosphohydrolase [Rhizobium calliandrae]MDL2406838.1 metal-dependent phosphohydrolase [Rhizobium calliandrae]
MLKNISAPDSGIARDAEELARANLTPMLFNHVMRCYWFAELFAAKENSTADRELIFLSSTLHDLGFSELGRGPGRFEVEGAHAARKFLIEKGVDSDRAWKVWSNIALHTWDLNLFKEDEARIMELGLLYDVVGVPNAGLHEEDVAEIVGRYPRLGFKRGFHELLCEELDTKKPYPHFVHICTCIANSRSPLPIPDAQDVLNGAPFDE